MKKIDKSTSYRMSRIKGKNTKPERIVRKFLHKNGFRFRLHQKKLPGSPDIVLKKHNTVINVNGCFWHYHKCKNFKLPQRNRKFWEKKLLTNRKRDKLNIVKIKKLNLKVIEIWECQLTTKHLVKLLKKLSAT